MTKRYWWDLLGKLIRDKGEIPLDSDFCDQCGKIFPKEDIHLILVPGNDELHLCENCNNLPPSTWRNRFGHTRKLRDEGN